MKVFDLLLQLLDSDAEIPDDTLLGKLIQLKNNSSEQPLCILLPLYCYYYSFNPPLPPSLFIIPPLRLETNNLVLWLQGYMAIHALANLLGLYAALEVSSIYCVLPKRFLGYLLCIN